MPPNTTGPMTAVIVAPGGGYRALSMNKEGRIPANQLNALGVAAFVLKYRLGPKYRHPIELGDMQRAIRIVRSRAAEWHIAPDKIGVMGFSAGGHLASTASTQFDRGNADCGRCDRSRQQPPRFRDPRLSGDHACPRRGRIRDRERCCSARTQTAARAQSFDRYARVTRHAAHVSVPHERRHGCPCGKQRLLLSRSPEGRRAGRNAHLQGWPARSRHADERHRTFRVAEGARELDARERISVTVQTIQKSVAAPSDFR